MPAPWPPDAIVLEAQPVDDLRLHRWVRAALGLLAVGLTAVFGLARYLEPDPRGLGTHQQLGLPPCTFHRVTGVPCPSCGMTTSFSHLAHGDLLNSLRANPVGTLLAAFCLAAIPWCVVSAVSGRRWLIHDFEALTFWSILILFVLLLTTWSIRLAGEFGLLLFDF